MYAKSFDSDLETAIVAPPKTRRQRKRVFKVFKGLLEGLSCVAIVAGFALFVIAMNVLFFTSFAKLLGVSGTESISVNFAAISLPLSLTVFAVAMLITKNSYSDVSGCANLTVGLELLVFLTFVLVCGSLALANPETVRNVSYAGGVCMVVFGSIPLAFFFMIFFGN